MALLAAENTNIPIHGYEDYSKHALIRINEANKFLTIVATVYVPIIFLIYTWQAGRFCKQFDRNMIPIHCMGLFCLVATALYCGLLFVDAHSLHDHLPAFPDDCLTVQRIHLMSLIVVKTTANLTCVFNLSYMNQNPFFNPRYKYVGKKRRKFLRTLFRVFKAIVALSMPLGLYSGYTRVECDHFVGPPNEFEYCYMTFTTKAFLLLFGADAAGILLYALLFGRQAFDCTARSIKIDNEQMDIDPISPTAASRFDADDPLQQSLVIPGRSSSMLSRDRSIQHPLDPNAGNIGINSMLPSENPVQSNQVSRESSVIADVARERYYSVDILEQRGMRELQRVLRLIWFMFGSYWVNLLWYAFGGLYTSAAAICLPILATCILLLNDYEFSKAYWKRRDAICNIISCCWCGVRKPSLEALDDYRLHDQSAEDFNGHQVINPTEKSFSSAHVYHN